LVANGEGALLDVNEPFGVEEENKMSGKLSKAIAKTGGGPAGPCVP